MNTTRRSVAVSLSCPLRARGELTVNMEWCGCFLWSLYKTCIGRDENDMMKYHRVAMGYALP